MQNQSNTSNCCEVPKDLHGTSCGWINAHIPIDTAGSINDPRHPGYKQNFNTWYQSSQPGNTAPVFVTLLKPDANYANGDLLVKFQAVKDKTLTAVGGAVPYRLSFEVYGDDAGLLDMLTDVMLQNKHFRNMCRSAIVIAEAAIIPTIY